MSSDILRSNRKQQAPGQHLRRHSSTTRSNEAKNKLAAMCNDVREWYAFCQHYGRTWCEPCADYETCETSSITFVIQNFCPRCLACWGYGSPVFGPESFARPHDGDGGFDQTRLRRIRRTSGTIKRRRGSGSWIVVVERPTG